MPTNYVRFIFYYCIVHTQCLLFTMKLFTDYFVWHQCHSITDCLLLFFILATSKDGCQLVTVHTHGDFIQLSHWETGLPVLWRDIPLSHTILTLSEPVLAICLYCQAWLRSDKYKSLSHWFDLTRVQTHKPLSSFQRQLKKKSFHSQPCQTYFLDVLNLKVI